MSLVITNVLVYENSESFFVPILQMDKTFFISLLKKRENSSYLSIKMGKPLKSKKAFYLFLSVMEKYADSICCDTFEYSCNTSYMFLYVCIKCCIYVYELIFVFPSVQC